ncbi:MAG: CocE/NonD family hydrolase [Clostridia bacterium]|nr:CocE/NonD family hydrolase [Clostridia bacterium]
MEKNLSNKANHYAYYEYIEIEGNKLFTVILLPEKDGSFPTVVLRSPYVQNQAEQSEDDIVQNCLNSFDSWLSRGYAAVFQHCRGQGKSTGAFIPYVHEREDGLALLQWIRCQAFYNGEIFLYGASYTASLHYTIAPFESDIKGAIFEVQDTERYRLWYRNGQMRKGHANWHFGLYKKKCGLNKTHNINSFSELPLKDLSERVLNDRAEDFEEMLEAENPSHEFWNTRFGGIDAKNATDNADIPILLTTGYNDFYVGGMFRMWNNMNEQTKKKSAMLVSPYDHGDGFNPDRSLSFPTGKRREQFGNSYQIDWVDNIRKGTPIPFEKGIVTYYRTFDDKWQSDFYAPSTTDLSLPLGTDTVAFDYDPLNPPAFCGEGTFQKNFDGRSDVVSLYTTPLEQDIFIRGQMRAVLTVSSSCPDTSFYINISIRKPQGDYVLRHDITSLCYQLGEYTENEIATLNFCFDEHAFLLKKGESLRIDISSTDNNTYVCHTNRKGAYYLQTGADKAINKVYLQNSKLILPIEE